MLELTQSRRKFLPSEHGHRIRSRRWEYGVNALSNEDRRDLRGSRKRLQIHDEEGRNGDMGGMCFSEMCASRVE